MCGIIGCVGHDTETTDVLVEGLSTLEYRGYDSAGVALADGQLAVTKRSGTIDELRKAVDIEQPDGPVGIGHTRWSTHGPPTDENAHPHTDCTGDVAVVHNGIIENYQELRDELGEDHTFLSETDTEVVPHLIEEALETGADPETAVRQAVSRLEGSFAVAVVIAGLETVFAVRNDSPLVLGLGSDGGEGPADAYYLASDVPAFRAYTDRVVYLDDGEFARIDPDGWTVSTIAGEPVEKTVDTVEWDPEETGKAGYDHFMAKEINEQPRSLRQGLSERVDELAGEVDIGDLAYLNPRGVQLVACGTSYHAAVYGAQLFRDAGVPAQAFLAHEYASAPPPVGDDLVIGVTQSGETADTLSALRAARSKGATTLAVTNVVASTAARECDHVFYIKAGPEIGVAATKTFASQLTALNLLATGMVPTKDDRESIAALRDLPADVQEVLDESQAEAVAETYLDSDAYFFLGRGLQYPVALEGALKMKEITYKHAEGFAAGELKHGPLALVTANTPVFAMVTGDGEQARKTIGNVKEVEARDAPVVAVTDGQSDVERYADHVLSVPESPPRTAAVLTNVQLQLAAYHTAAKLGRPIDKPRNLAKSVTVE
ncbi:glucosamine/fructose-6-phosphate aminotransferase, isomerizing [Halorhabdus utahensis DSM 12940]|uniref:Glutamine--fructose-6-phosphate aminotransferase [isomerizing] n=1 Tax=Halorhabdus utahensis (strain DSM 12940 / JCM 11049 / AX-2) TaxID=519442 RepID=C7NV91_HALUD|nr:glutamine--fructose-6-phosphate transaminase (isomerizing) [Halorhabdus utahensis]ACV11175.1 glucosamine/fructose-6-phosphate aminotransferase, isomerizing [Halorhabdus utahensis DSM 12940]